MRYAYITNCVLFRYVEVDMKSARTLLLFSMILALPFTVPLSTSYAEEAEAESACFVDIDGDGIDDNARDMNDDGIPDIIANDDESEEMSDVKFASNLGDFSVSMATNAAAESSKSRAGAFSSRRFSARGISSDRGGIESSDGFGPGSGIGIGAVKTPVCVGGVCIW